jgi:hypothetical protein
MFIKLGGKYFNWEDITLIEEDVASTTYPGHTTVRFQYRNRQDEAVNVAGKPVHMKHGVYELPPDLSEKFRWFLSTFGPGIGIADVAERYARRAEIEEALRVNRESKGLVQPELPHSRLGEPLNARQGRVLQMPPLPTTPES